MLLKSRLEYTYAERMSDAVIHIAALAIGLAAVPVLITLTAFLRSEPHALVAISVYGAALLTMILSSALYNMVPWQGWSGVLKRIDHSAIYIKIAATYTPFLLLSGDAQWLLVWIWAAACAGIGFKIVAPDRFRLLGLILYVAMGWAGLIAGGVLLPILPFPVLLLAIIGGVLYMIGLAFYLLDRLPFHYTIWHICVMTASFVFYAAVMVDVVARPV